MGGKKGGGGEDHTTGTPQLEGKFVMRVREIMKTHAFNSVFCLQTHKIRDPDLLLISILFSSLFKQAPTRTRSTQHKQSKAVRSGAWRVQLIIAITGIAANTGLETEN